MRTETVNDWTPETKTLLEYLLAAGFEIRSGDNGEEQFKFDPSKLGEFIDNLTACDESRLYIAKGGEKFGLYLVYGNSPGELVCDYAWSAKHENSPVHMELERLFQIQSDRWSGCKQPTKQVTY